MGSRVLALAAACCLVLAVAEASTASDDVQAQPAPTGRPLLGGRPDGLQQRMIESADGEGGSMTDWEVECQEGRLRCPSAFLASWGYQCVTRDGRACCRKPDGRSCRSLEDWRHAEQPASWHGAAADSSPTAAADAAAVDPKPARQAQPGGRAAARLRSLSTEDAPSDAPDASDAQTATETTSESGADDADESGADDDTAASRDGGDGGEPDAEGEGPASYDEAKWGKDGKGERCSKYGGCKGGDDSDGAEEGGDEDGEGRARRGRKERGGYGSKGDADDDSGSSGGSGGKAGKKKGGKRGSGGGGRWRKATATHYTSYPACCHDRNADQSECEDYSGCKWEGMFKGLRGKQPKSWVERTNLVAVFEAPNSRNRQEWDRKWKNKRLRLKHPDTGKTLDVLVVDTCDDDDCDGCCTRNARRGGGLLVDLEWHTARRFWGKGGVRDVSQLQVQVLKD